MTWTTPPTWVPGVMVTAAQLQILSDDLTTVKGAQIATTADFTIYVATTGSDVANDGLSVGSPFRTIQKAISIIPHSVVNNVTIQLADGTYLYSDYAGGNTTSSGGSITSYSTKDYHCMAYVTNTDIREGSSILILGNPTTPANVVIDGQGLCDATIFALEAGQINLRGLTIQNATASALTPLANVLPKRRSNMQIKDCVIGAAANEKSRVGIYSYQFAEVEIQGNTTIQNCVSNSVDVLIFSYFNATGLTTSGCGNDISCTSSSQVELGNAIAACVLNSNGVALTLAETGFIDADHVTFSGGTQLANNAGGRLVVSSAISTINPTSNALILTNRLGTTEVLGGTFDSGVVPASAAYSAVTADNGIVSVNQATIGTAVNGFYHGMVTDHGGIINVQSTVINNSHYDGINCGTGTVMAVNTTSTTSNGRYGINCIAGGRFIDEGSNTVGGASGSNNAVGLSLVQGLIVGDAKDIAVGTGTGTKIGTATSQKLGFYGATPVVQTTGAVDVLAGLVTLGLRAASLNPPLNLGTGALTAGAAALAATTVTTLGTGGLMTLADGNNIVVGSSSGTQIATATTQKLGFFGKTPVVQITGSTDVLASLVTLGLRAASSNPPLNLGTGTVTCGLVLPASGTTSILANNATWTIPVGATTLKLTLIGGGGGGGGGGSTNTSVSQTGGGGGGAGVITEAIVAVGANTTLAVVIGAGGTAGSGGAAGANSGTLVAANNGNATTVTATGIALTAAGGGGGQPSTHDSSGSYAGGQYGLTYYTSVNGTPGMGGASAGVGHPSFGFAAGGGGGGGTATTTNGGGGGAAGASGASVAAGVSGASGTAAGVVGVSAAANSGGGGGGGGGGAYNGGAPGAGGNGGVGGSGLVIVEVVG